ncbi:MAG: sulfate ABC transporter substrate-binding protein [Actinomycetia bacterium]|nr:sulfate ABC transporter substrate-binding protein [Actinomycetes bacterium]MCH9703018.1 sulfate ABC transporter substrate-binding protein [Actinomycetes bacterium]MCH9759130.1 sulfate ABC transporter substrate-binding protein [Actinomycetes bacterium]
MQKIRSITSQWRTAVALVLSASTVAACGGGPSDVLGAGSGPADETTLTLVAFAVPELGWSTMGPAFAATEGGEGVTVTGSYGASADQARAVESGTPADIVNFSVEPDITRLVAAGEVDDTWNAGATRGIPFGSVVTLAVRPGNPKNIRDWNDLLQPGLEVVTPSPLSSGAAKWNLLAPYAWASSGGRDPAAGIAFVSELVSEHIRSRPVSGREATEMFARGSGDVLLAYESEAIHFGLDYVNPPQTIKIESPVAVVKTSQHQDKAREFVNFLFTPDAQKLWAQANFRPVDPAVLAEFADKFPAPEKLWAVDELGGWEEVDAELFNEDGGSITKIYQQATG